MFKVKRHLPFVWAIAMLFSVCKQASAQKNAYNEVSISAPTAASLGKYADIPVSYHTGIPEISIPLYTVKEGPLTLPISLSYHASGIRVMEPASWTGAGWSLNAGGVITRTVRGAPDERGTSSVNDQTKGYLSDSGYNSYQMFVDNTLPNGVNFYDDQFRQGKMDGEPDMFSYNFNGASGKFYFHDDGTVRTVPYQDVKITYTYTGTGSIQNFTITTSDGTKYDFGMTASASDTDAIERTNPYNAQAGMVGGTVISSWYLNKITSADGVFSITLSYTPENYGCFTFSMFPVPSGNTGDQDPNNNYEYQLVKDIVSGVRLNRITFSNGRVDFVANTVRTDVSGNFQDLTDDANTQAKALDSIKIWNGGSNCKKFALAYSYFQDNTSALPGFFNNYTITSDKKRLKLLSVQELSCDGSATIPAYTFDYFTELPTRRLSFGQDHWGFINGITTNTTVIPTYVANDTSTIVGADRDCHWPAMRGGALQRIHYPTGGFSEFDFEPNYTWVSYNKTVVVNRYYFTAGFDGSSAEVDYLNKAFSGAPYRLKFINSNVGGDAIINIYNSGGTNVYGTSLTQGHSTSVVLNLTAGNYKIAMQKLSAVSGQGAEAYFDEYTTVSVQKNDTVGGLRIKTLTHSDGLSSQKIITSYSYESNGKSTGVLYTRPVYVTQVRNDLLEKTGGATLNQNDPPYCSPNGCIACDMINGIPMQQEYYKSGAGIRPMESTQGNHIGYSEVKVSQAGNGYTLYRYFSTPGLDTIQSDVAKRVVSTNGCDPTTPSFPYAPLPLDYKRGDLKYEGYFTEYGELLKDKTYTPVYFESSLTTPCIAVSNISTWKLATFYELKSATKLSDTVVEASYSNGQALRSTTIVYHESSFHNMPTRSQTTTTTGDILESKTKYAMDFRISNCDTISDCSGAYGATALSALITYETTWSNCLTHYCQYWAWDLYRKTITNARNTYIHCRTKYLTGATSFATCMTNAKTAADAQLKPILELREVFKNAPIEASSWKNSQLLSADFTSYDYSTNPSGKVYPVKTQQINLQAPSGTFTVASTSANNISITKDSRYEDENVIKFNGGNLSEVTPKTGITSTYIWDYNNNLPIAKVMNATNAQVAYTSFEANGSGNWTIGSATRTTGDGTTGSQCYQLSNGTVSKTGLTSTFGYTVSYWTKNASAFTITGTQGTPLKGKTIAGWTYYEHSITGVTSITLSGTGLIDELRLYPVQGQMLTYTYDPLNGMTSQCDVNNVITYYEYDALRRLKVIKDQDKNVIKTIDYKYQTNQ